MTLPTVPPPEPRWPALLGAAALGGLYMSFPKNLSFGPNWLMLAVLGVLLVPTVVTHQMGKDDLNHRFGLVVSAVMTLALAWSIARLIATLPEKREEPIALLRSAGALWASNVLVFATWYWRLDAGGPHMRDRNQAHVEGSFLFPQMTLKGDKAWRPGFVDYLSLAFNTSTAFSPADVAPLTRWAKSLMMLQSTLSLTTLAILAARAINTL